MIRGRFRLVSSAVVAAALCPLWLAADARAQAWVPGQGEGAVTVALQTMRVQRHLAATTAVDAGDVDSRVLLTDVTYGLTSRMAVDFSVPLVASSYRGPVPHPGTDIDNGAWQTSFTDLRFALRYNLKREGTVITPYVGSITPSHDYAFYGHAAPGLGLREVQVGVYAAKLVERGLPGLFISGRYAFGFVEQVLDISRNRSLADLEAGYFFSSRFRAFTMASSGYTHGGIDFPAEGLRGLPPALRPNHDQIQRVHFLNLGVGGAYSLTDALDVFGSASRQVAGRNGHALDYGVTVGLSWGFRRRNSPAEVAAVSAPASDPVETDDGARRAGSLLRCICQKS